MTNTISNLRSVLTTELPNIFFEEKDYGTTYIFNAVEEDVTIEIKYSNKNSKYSLFLWVQIGSNSDDFCFKIIKDEEILKDEILELVNKFKTKMESLSKTLVTIISKI